MIQAQRSALNQILAHASPRTEISEESQVIGSGDVNYVAPTTELTVHFILNHPVLYR